MNSKISYRPSWKKYFLNIVDLVAQRSTCLRRSVGAVIVKSKRIISTGYNGAPSGIKHCKKIGCLRKRLNILSGEKHELCRGLHAEQNAIIQSALHGIRIKNSTLYCTNHPCGICAKMIINAGITKIVYKNMYHDSIAQQILHEANVIGIKG